MVTMKYRLGLLLLIMFTSAHGDVVGHARVVDGDTIEVNRLRIRLNGIDTPESHQTCKRNDVIWACGRDATIMTTRLIDGHQVQCIGGSHDRYGRLIADCFTQGININSMLVKLGMALAYRQYSVEYVAEEEIARQEKLGLWSGKFVAPWAWRKGERLP